MSKESKIEKLKKLLVLASGNANEAEAMAALAKAQEYAATYGLNIDNIKTEEGLKAARKGYGKSSSIFSGFGGNTDSRLQFAPVDALLWKDIARFCDVMIGVTKDSDGDNCIEYYGQEADVELAIYLRATIAKAMDFEWSVHEMLLDNEYRPNMQTSTRNMQAAMNKVFVLKHSFWQGMADRLRERMMFLHRQRTEAATEGSDSRALMVVKEKMLAERAKEDGFRSAVGARGQHHAVDSAMYATGHQRGGAVDLGRGVSAKSPLAIGRR